MRYFLRNINGIWHQEQFKQNPPKLCNLKNWFYIPLRLQRAKYSKKEKDICSTTYQESYGNYNSPNVFSPSLLMTTQYFILDWYMPSWKKHFLVSLAAKEWNIQEGCTQHCCFFPVIPFLFLLSAQELQKNILYLHMTLKIESIQ